MGREKTGQFFEYPIFSLVLPINPKVLQFIQLNIRVCVSICRGKCHLGSIHLRAEIAFRAENFGKVFWQVFHAKIFRAEISCRKFWHVAKILAQNFGTEFWHENSMPKLFCAKILSQNFGTVPKLLARNDISAPR